MQESTFTNNSLLPKNVEAEQGAARNRRHRSWVLTPARLAAGVLAAVLLAIVVGVFVYLLTTRACLGKRHHRPANIMTDQSEESTAAEPVDIRLPTTLVPDHYTITLRPQIFHGDPSDFRFSGTVLIIFNCTQNTDRIVLHAKDLDISSDSIFVTSMGGTLLNAVHVEKDKIRQFLNIRLAQLLQAGGTYGASISFTGPLTKDMHGLYISTYEENGEKKYLLASQLQPAHAREVFPCMDEPQLKSTFDVIIERPRNMTAMSNTRIDFTAYIDEEWEADHFGRTPRMCTYLLAFSVSNFLCTERLTTSGTQVEVCSRPDTINNTLFAADVSVSILEYYEDFHNISYPLSKMTHLALPDFAYGGMENWGLIVYQEFNLLYDPQTSTAQHKQMAVLFMAHELAHQWFGNLVSMEWWDDLWLNEGFASYMEVLGADHVFPEWLMEDDFVLDQVQRVFAQDGLATSHPVYQHVTSPEQIQSIFDSITYNKAAAVIRMVHHFLGGDTFRLGIVSYLKNRAYNTTTSADLFNALTRQAGIDGKAIDVGEVMRPWIQQMGYPVVTFRFSRGTYQVNVTQKHFLLSQSDSEEVPPSPYGYKWHVPISYITDQDQDWHRHHHAWLRPQDSVLVGDVPPDASWVLGNVNQRYYYRVNYNEENWRALIQQLHTDHTLIEVKNRAQLVDDSFNLGRAGETDMLRFFEVSRYLAREEGFIPWWAAMRAILNLNSLFSSSEYYGYFTEYVQQLVDAPFTRLGMADTGLSGHIENRMRSLLVRVACMFGHQGCLDQALIFFNQWLVSQESGEPNTLAADLRYTVYCAGIAAGSLSEWDAAFRSYRSSQDSAEQRTLLEALACTKQAWLLRRYLQLALDEVDIRRQNFIQVVTAVTNNQQGRTIAWEFLVDRWDILYERFGSAAFILQTIARVVTNRFDSEYYLNSVRHFIESTDNLGIAEPTFLQNLEVIQGMIDWKNANEEVIGNWLQREVHSRNTAL